MMTSSTNRKYTDAVEEGPCRATGDVNKKFGEVLQCDFQCRYGSRDRRTYILITITTLRTAARGNKQNSGEDVL